MGKLKRDKARCKKIEQTLDCYEYLSIPVSSVDNKDRIQKLLEMLQMDITEWIFNLKLIHTKVKRIPTIHHV
uniref:Uncharacterized protein n=1 Tax=Romanomermis culicivorax TaxID=13658 RepID=A0A915I8B8_ROMCU